MILGFPLQDYDPNVEAAEQELKFAWGDYVTVCRRSWVDQDNGARFRAAQERIDNAQLLVQHVKAVEEAA